MINLSILISSSEISGPGGLFDINATLPLVAIQFVLLSMQNNDHIYLQIQLLSVDFLFILLLNSSFSDCKSITNFICIFKIFYLVFLT